MKTEQLVIAQKEMELLKKHLKDSNLSDYNKEKLLAELKSAHVVDEAELPADAVCINSTVEIREDFSGQKFKFEIVLPTEANMKKHKISVFAPIGIALLGYRVGANVQWEMPNGLKTFTILKVDHSKENRPNLMASA